MKKTVFTLAISMLIFASILIPEKAFSCGHEGFFMGLGYSQLFQYTTEHENNPAVSRRITFGPGYGAHAVIGYDFKGTRWGMQFPFEFEMLKLNGDEWVQSYSNELEAIFHIVEWDSGFDIHLVGGAGWTYLTEGKLDNNSNSVGVIASLGPGFSWYFTRTEKVSGSLTMEVPFRFVHYFKDRLSAGGTTAVAFPIRLGVQIGF